MNILIKLDYQQDEVVSAQRMRLLRSNRLKWLSVLGVLGTIVLSAQQVDAWQKTGIPPESWYSPIYLLAIFGGVLLLTYLFVSPIDFRLNSQWRHVFDLHLDEKFFRVTTAGQSQGFEMAWEQINRIWENDKVYILFWGSEQEFVIFPKRVLQEHDNYFRERLNHNLKNVNNG